MLLENSVLLNRVTKSSIVRIISVEVGDMPKEMVGPHIQGIKNMIEQKSALNVGISTSEYTNPGPIENNIYVPTHEGKGAITVDSIGGSDVNVRDLADLDYYTNKFYGSLRVPKQYFCQTDDSTGFNGGTSLSIVSSRYAKTVKRIQNTLIQALTDVVNLMLLDSGLDNYINQFKIRMLPPTTQEEKDRRENFASRVSLVNDVMNLLGDIESAPVKLKVLNTMLPTIVNDDQVTQTIHDYIDVLEKREYEQARAESTELVGDEEAEEPEEDTEASSISFDDSGAADYDSNSPIDIGTVETSEETETATPPAEAQSATVPEVSALPTPAELGQDMTDYS